MNSTEAFSEAKDQGKAGRSVPEGAPPRIYSWDEPEGHGEQERMSSKTKYRGGQE